MPALRILRRLEAYLRVRPVLYVQSDCPIGASVATLPENLRNLVTLIRNRASYDVRPI